MNEILDFLGKVLTISTANENNVTKNLGVLEISEWDLRFNTPQGSQLVLTKGKIKVQKPNLPWLTDITGKFTPADGVVFDKIVVTGIICHGNTLSARAISGGNYIDGTILVM